MIRLCSIGLVSKIVLTFLRFNVFFQKSINRNFQRFGAVAHAFSNTGHTFVTFLTFVKTDVLCYTSRGGKAVFLFVLSYTYDAVCTMLSTVPNVGNYL